MLAFPSPSRSAELTLPMGTRDWASREKACGTRPPHAGQSINCFSRCPAPTLAKFSAPLWVNLSPLQGQTSSKVDTKRHLDTGQFLAEVRLGPRSARVLTCLALSRSTRRKQEKNVYHCTRGPALHPGPCRLTRMLPVLGLVRTDGGCNLQRLKCAQVGSREDK